MVFLSEMSGERPKILNLTIHRPTSDLYLVGVVEPSPNDKAKIVSLLTSNSDIREYVIMLLADWTVLAFRCLK